MAQRRFWFDCHECGAHVCQNGDGDGYESGHKSHCSRQRENVKRRERAVEPGFDGILN